MKIGTRIFTYILVFVIGLLFMPILHLIQEKNLEERVIYRITIDTEYINLRNDISLDNEPIMKVYKGEQYDVVEYYEGNSYNWYRIVYDDYKTGWIASGKKQSWVIIEREGE